ncbi:A/G-specific adenine glycosylase [Acuticoccus sp. MNP-M23]|uniref:A/G-specific adenine glycosylase n=1 Tax=Acuticoccus sp. MNP-M23 TaxID=3072793 RepID=UPI002815FC6E|nr:A/G-specific adenine glycosylase [Acuticoccus sp. MNP-M23]WMS43361.1 A/G-specific adenine glycosylase [Acuticoccus sp. MNP-M23]
MRATAGDGAGLWGKRAARPAPLASAARAGTVSAVTSASTLSVPEPGPATARRLLVWYDRHKRAMPWRATSGRTEPYKVWLSEVMLQQTTVAAVGPYFERFTARWPTVEALAGADDAAVMEAWAGLGYYARARNLLKCARAVAEAGGRFPATEAELRALPGIGAYTAAAVAAIAFDEPAPVVDGNVERVVARLVALERPPKAEMARVRGLVEAMVPEGRPGDFAQAMMDLGATICTPRNPLCALCPLNADCRAAAAGNPLDYPRKMPKKARAAWFGTVYAPFRPDGAALFRVRPAKGLLGAMPELFGTPWAPVAPDPAPHAPFAAPWRAAGAISHGFTHAELTLDVMKAEVAAGTEAPAGAYWRLPEEAGLPTLMAKAVRRALAADD